jgi:hypothetical protein
VDVQALRARIAALSLAVGAGRVTFEDAEPSPTTLRPSDTDAQEGLRLVSLFSRVADGHLRGLLVELIEAIATEP